VPATRSPSVSTSTKPEGTGAALLRQGHLDDRVLELQGDEHRQDLAEDRLEDLMVQFGPPPVAGFEPAALREGLTGEELCSISILVNPNRVEA
jgi:hypothetical protein